MLKWYQVHICSGKGTQMSSSVLSVHVHSSLLHVTVEMCVLRSCQSTHSLSTQKVCTEHISTAVAFAVLHQTNPVLITSGDTNEGHLMLSLILWAEGWVSDGAQCELIKLCSS